METKRGRRTLGFAALALVVAGCHHGPSVAHVPPEIAGDIPVSVANNYVDPICGVSFLEDPSKFNNLVQGQLATGAKIDAKIRPGTYTVVAIGCSSNYGAKADNVKISGPTYVSIDTPKVPPPAGYTLVRLGAASGAEACVPNGSEAHGMSTCCSGHEASGTSRLCVAQ